MQNGSWPPLFFFWVSVILLMTENFHYHYSQQKLYSFFSFLETMFKKFPNLSFKKGGVGIEGAGWQIEINCRFWQKKTNLNLKPLLYYRINIIYKPILIPDPMQHWLHPSVYILEESLVLSLLLSYMPLLHHLKIDTNKNWRILIISVKCTVDSHCLEFGWLEFSVELNFYRSPKLRCV